MRSTKTIYEKGSTALTMQYNRSFLFLIYIILGLSGLYSHFCNVAYASSGLEDPGNILLDEDATRYEPQIDITQYPLPEDITPMSNITIYANVTDIFGEIQNATLSYSFGPNGLSRVSSMDLFYGNRSNGIFYGIIPAQNNAQEIIVKYKVHLQDDLGYSAISNEGEFSIPGKVKVEDSVEIRNQVEPNIVALNKTVVVSAYVTAFDSNATIENVTLYYTSNYSENEEEEEEAVNFTSLEMNMNSSADSPEVSYVEDLTNVYEATIGPFDYDDDVTYYVVAYDNLSRRDSSENNTFEVGDPGEQEEPSTQPSTGEEFLNAIDLIANVEDMDVKNLTATLEFQLDSFDLDKSLLLPSNETEIYKIDSNNRLTDLNEASAFDLTVNSSSSQGEEDSNVIEESGSNGDDVDIRIQNRGIKPITFSLDGTPSAYPFDEYHINLLLAVPFTNAKLDGSSLFESQINSTWDTSLSQILQIYNDNIIRKNIASDCQIIPEIKNSLLCGDSRRAENGSSIIQVNLNFKRNASVAIILVPLIAIFFLLGAIFIFDFKDVVDLVNTRLVLTLGVFAVIFSLPEIIDSGKPLTSAPTIADSMLSIIIIATITFTASSVVSSSSVIQNKFPKRWRWIDGIIFLFVSGVVIAYFVFSNYPKTIVAWLVPLIILALGYGLLLRITSVKIGIIRKLIIIGGSVATISVLAIFASFYYPSSYIDQNSLSEILDPKLVTLKNSSGLDKYGIAMIYPTKKGGEEWYMTSADPESDKRVNYRERPGPRGDIRYNIETSEYADAGQDYIPAIDHSQFHKTGYIFSQSDWKNIEMTGYINANDVSDGNLIWYARGERHTEEDKGCLGTAYRGEIAYEGHTRFRKEQRHSSEGYASIEEIPNMGSIIGKWVGMKMIVYNFEQNGKVNVNMEMWVDKNKDGNWTKIDQWIDSGGWGDQGRVCGGEIDQIITWGGPIATFRINGIEDTRDVEIEKLSIREIEPPDI